MTTRAPTVLSHWPRLGLSELIKVVSRMCSLRRRATTVPSIANHRNRKLASSSVHISGRLKT